MDPMTPGEFESNIRRVARAMWPDAEDGGAELVDGREVDGLFHTAEVVHMVEASMSRKVEKAKEVGPKLQRHLKKHRASGGLFAKAWFVTNDDPTAEQKKVLRDFDPSIQVLSFDQFRAKLIDGREYLKLRNEAPWGSAVDPVTEDRRGLGVYVPRQVSFLRASGIANTHDSLSVKELADLLTEGTSAALVGDYGVGKSVTVREVHKELAVRYLKGTDTRFPVTLNLRNHYGQTDPAEALHRHARQIGFPHGYQLVQAWLAGFVYILLDGFDELATQGWSGSPERLRDNRRAATKLISEFTAHRAHGPGYLVAGRRYYFDSLTELSSCIFGSGGHAILALGDFTPEQAQNFLKGLAGQQKALPPWLPARPLLLGYLAAEKDMISRIDNGDVIGMSPAQGWDWLLPQICQRESFIKNGMDGPAVRAILERLASIARSTPQGVGPFSPFDIVDAFVRVRNQRPSDEEITLLQRLPGLGGREDSEEGTRSFIDVDLASAAQAGDIRAFIRDPYQKDPPSSPATWSSSLEPLGVSVAAHLADEESNSGHLRTAIRAATGAGYDVLATDLVRVALEMNVDNPRAADARPIVISDVIVPEFCFNEDGPGMSGISFSQCLIDQLVINGEPSAALLPRFTDCSFGSVFGRLGPTDLPVGVFDNCKFDDFPDGVDRNASILKAESLPLGTRVTMTLLRKLYLQRGSGRKENALGRGMSQDETGLVMDAMRLLQREGLAFYSKQGRSVVWMPDRSAGPRVRAYLESPRVGDDPLINLARELSPN
jgi:hypothetical protein